MWNIFAAGFLGGVIRALVGLTKYLRGTPTKKRTVRKEYIILSLLSSGGIGLMAGLFIATDIKFALLAGYAGTDFIENIFKAKMKTKSWD